MRKNIITVIAALAMILVACGYKFAGGGKLPLGETIFVDVFENRTAETGIENIFTTDLRYEFIRNKMVVSRDKADGILSGVVKSLHVETISRKGQHTSLERRVTAAVDLRLQDRDGQVVWSVTGVSASESYPVTLDENSSIDVNKRNAIIKLSKRLAENIYYRLTEDF